MRTISFEKNIPKVLLTRALGRVWRDVVFSSFSPTRYAEIPDPPLPGPRWVRVRNRVCGICGSDLNILLVRADPQVAPAALPGTDRVYLGHEVVGEVAEVGPGVSTLGVGDRVILNALGPNCLNQEIEPPCRHCREGNVGLCQNASLGRGGEPVGGGWGDSMVTHETSLYKVPDELGDEAAALIEPLSVSVHAAMRRLPEAGERALVVGCGTIGLGAIEALRALAPGSTITAMARYPQQEAMARKLGADELIGHEEPYATVARLTGGKLYEGAFGSRMILGGYDVVYDCVGTGRTVQDSLRWARAGGTVVLVGISLTRMQVDLTPAWYQEVALIGTYSHGIETVEGRRLSTYDLIVEALRQGRMTTEGFVTHRFPPEAWQEAARTALDKRSGAIKVVMVNYGRTPRKGVPGPGRKPGGLARAAEQRGSRPTGEPRLFLCAHNGCLSPRPLARRLL
jgi:threonine dehydrogenase-like Zn-dependent dehydrogenase